VEGDQETITSQKLLHHLGHHKDLEQEAMSKNVHAFAEHLAIVFKPHHSENEHEEEEALIHLLDT
jgi:hypothetical protein